MRRARARALAAGAFAIGLSVLSAPSPAAAQLPRQDSHWVATWGTALVARAVPPRSPVAPSQPPGGGPQPIPRFNNQTLRQVVRVSIGGDRFRVVLSNAFGTGSLDIGAARIALKGSGSSTPAAGRALTFNGRSSTSIPAGTVIVSDAVSLTVPSIADLVIDVYLPGDVAESVAQMTTHAGAQQSNFVSTIGNHVGEAIFPVASVTTSWFFLGRVEVIAAAEVSAVVVLGDSITDGARSTLDANNRWTDLFAKAASERKVPLGVVNAGIAGNSVLVDGSGASALARFDRDVLVPPGVRHLIIMHGINDIGRGARADELIDAYRQLIERARSHGLRVIGATLTPIEDTSFQGFYTPVNEATRQAVNQWIRTSGAYDAVIDFDAVLRDLGRPTKLRADFASADYIHPNDRGYRAMADAVDPLLFTSTTATLSPR